MLITNWISHVFVGHRNHMFELSELVCPPLDKTKLSGFDLSLQLYMILLLTTWVTAVFRFAKQTAVWFFHSSSCCLARAHDLPGTSFRPESCWNKKIKNSVTTQDAGLINKVICVCQISDSLWRSHGGTNRRCRNKYEYVHTHARIRIHIKEAHTHRYTRAREKVPTPTRKKRHRKSSELKTKTAGQFRKKKKRARFRRLTLISLKVFPDVLITTWEAESQLKHPKRVHSIVGRDGRRVVRENYSDRENYSEGKRETENYAM